MYFCKIDNALFVLHYGEVRKIIHEITGDAGKALTYNVRYAFDPGHVKRNDKLVEDYLQGMKLFVASREVSTGSQPESRLKNCAA